MEEVYLITGVTGFLGRIVAEKLVKANKKVIGLRLPGDKESLLPEVNYQIGDITKPYSLVKFFEQAQGKKAVERGLNARIVHPSGIIGPGGYSGGYMTETIKAYLKGYCPRPIEETLADVVMWLKSGRV